MTSMLSPILVSFTSHLCLAKLTYGALDQFTSLRYELAALRATSGHAPKIHRGRIKSLVIEG